MYQIGQTNLYSMLLPLLIAFNIVLGLLLISWMDRCRRLVARANIRHKRYRATIDNLAEGVYLRSIASGKMIKANASLVSLNGYSTREEMLEHANDPSVEWYVDPRRFEEFKRRLERDGEVRDFVSEVYRHKTRERIWVTEQAHIINHEKTGKPAFYEGTIRDITPLIRQRQLEERLEKLADNLPGGLFQLVRRPDGSFTCPYISSGFRKLFGIDDSANDISPDIHLSRINPQDLPAYLRSLHESARSVTLWTHEFRCRLNDGRMAWLMVSATPEKQEDGSVIWYGFLTDISERKDAEHQFRQYAYYDALTDLPNRRLFTERLELALATTARHSEYGAVAFIDLDNFKALNDTHGHEAGDRLLRQVAIRMSSVKRKRDTVGRFAGDEFVMLMNGLGSDYAKAEANAVRIARRTLGQFTECFILDGVRHFATPSIGVVIFDGRSQSIREILRNADLAMYEAKRRGRNNYVIFEADKGSQAPVKLISA